MARQYAFFFGLDTIASNLPLVHARAIAEVLRAHRISVSPEDIVRRYPDQSSRFIFETLVEEAGKRHCVPDPIVLRAEKWSHMETLPADEICLIPGTAAFIRAMHAKSVPLGIVSAAPCRFVELVLRAVELRPCFRVIVSVEDVGKPKSKPDVFCRGAQLLYVEPKDCIAIEHRESGMIGARAAGMRCIAFSEDPATIDVPVDWVVADLRQWTPGVALAA